MHCPAVLYRFKVIDMLKDYEMGPFTVTPLRVTHSIPDCCGLIMRRCGWGGVVLLRLGRGH